MLEKEEKKKDRERVKGRKKKGERWRKGKTETKRSDKTMELTIRWKIESFYRYFSLSNQIFHLVNLFFTLCIIFDKEWVALWEYFLPVCKNVNLDFWHFKSSASDSRTILEKFLNFVKVLWKNSEKSRTLFFISTP